MPIALGIVVFVLTAILLLMLSKIRAAKQDRFIREYRFPRGLLAKLDQHHPNLGVKDKQLVQRGLRKFLLAYLHGGRKQVSMPSQVVDDLWHEFILYTREYDEFCKQAFGHFFHHTPAGALGTNKTSNIGLRRVWWYACVEETINPRQPTRLPLLFALDSKLKIANGFFYTVDCTGLIARAGEGSSVTHCGSDFASTSVDGSTEGFGDFSSSSDGGSDSSGGGDGCGGGCGGGGD